MPLYAKIDCSYPDDPKVIDAGDIAELVYLRCLLPPPPHPPARVGSTAWRERG